MCSFVLEGHKVLYRLFPFGKNAWHYFRSFSFLGSVSPKFSPHVSGQIAGVFFWEFPIVAPFVLIVYIYMSFVERICLGHECPHFSLGHTSTSHPLDCYIFLHQTNMTSYFTRWVVAQHGDPEFFFLTRFSKDITGRTERCQAGAKVVDS